MKAKSTSIFIGLVLVLFGLMTGLLAMEKRVPTAALAGDWQGNARIIVAWCNQTNLAISITIDSDGKVTGKIGDATLVNGSVKKNRTWLGKKLNLATDYIILGQLDGPIVASENIIRSEIYIPFNLSGGNLRGGLATSGSKIGGKEKMVFTASQMKLLQFGQH